jgi:hypothetical protein
LLKTSTLLGADASEKMIDRKIKAFSRSMRETDILGWYENGSTLGVILTEIGDAPENSITCAFLNRTEQALGEPLDVDSDGVRLTFNFYPKDLEGQSPPAPASSFAGQAVADSVGFSLKKDRSRTINAAKCY